MGVTEGGWRVLNGGWSVTMSILFVSVTEGFFAFLFSPPDGPDVCVGMSKNRLPIW